MTEMELDHGDLPKKARKALEKLKQAGMVPLMVYPAVPRGHQSEKEVALARVGAFDEERIGSWILVTDRDVVFLRPGLLRDRVDRISLSEITGIEYVDEFQDNTLKIRIGGAAEAVRFYHEIDGVRFFRHIKAILDEKA
ncbi:MAG: hypothetical protein NUK54_00630 [Methanothrix sp.]|nr:hypothetical protein [Methanothrix sp.]